MSMNRAQVDRGANNVSAAGVGDALMSQIGVVGIATVGSGAWTAAGMLAGCIERTGPTGAYGDTLETANNLMLAAPHLSVGDTFEFLVRNTVAFANTVAVAEGAELSGSNTAIAASLVRRYLVTVLANRTRQTFMASTTNASPTVTGLTQAQCDLLQAGMGVSGTGISAGTTIVGINSLTGTITLSANATATGTPALTFFPRYNVKGLYSTTL